MNTNVKIEIKPTEDSHFTELPNVLYIPEFADDKEVFETKLTFKDSEVINKAWFYFWRLANGNKVLFRASLKNFCMTFSAFMGERIPQSDLEYMYGYRSFEIMNAKVETLDS